MVNMIICGDFVPTETNIEYFISGNIEEVVDSAIFEYINSSDFRVFNLEAPLCDKLAPIKKCGPHINIPTKAINGIKKFNPSLFCLANNHILDHGEEGLNSTTNCLEKNNIKHFGTGKNINNVAKSSILEKDGIKIGIYCCCEHEFSIAEEDKAGANPFDIFNSFDDIKALKNKTDYVVVLYHGGREEYRYPSILLQKTCRKFVDSGADVVVCQHSHCIGCEEIYKNSNIIYGQGNFIFDYDDAETWQTSLILILNFENNKVSVEKYPIQKDKYKIKKPEEHFTKEIITNFNARSQEILDKNFLVGKYKAEALSSLSNYINVFSSLNIEAMRNYLDCEAHREIFSFALKNLSDEDLIRFKQYKRKKFIGIVKKENGRRVFYFLGLKIFSYRRK